MSDSVVLYSGGLDSTVLLLDLKKQGCNPVALGFSYGSKHNHRELSFAKRQCLRNDIPLKIIPLGFIGRYFTSSLLKGGDEIPLGEYEKANMRQTAVPFRNGIMLAVAAGYAESIKAGSVAIAAHDGAHALYPDCTEGFMLGMSSAIERGTYDTIKLLRPYIGLSKADIVRRGNAIGVDFSRTWSCYRGERWHCGECGTCRERRQAFSEAGIVDPTRYESA